MIRSVNLLDEGLLAGAASDEEAGFGALETERGSLPLVALDVRARLAGLTSHVTVRQTFRNALDEPLEATYIFPLPDRAAVTSFRMKVGQRVVEGQLKERSQARADYQQAIEDGHRAAIAEEERSGTFNLRVGNIPPREEVTVELVLVGPLPVAGGEATFRFPLVVAPRYVPGIPLDGPSVGAGWASDTDQAPDASRVTPPVLLPGFPNPVRLSLEVELDPAGLLAADTDLADLIRSSLHSVILDDGPPCLVRLQPGERLNRDFVLRFPVAGDTIGTVLQVAGKDGGADGTFALTLVPPAITESEMSKPRDVVFVLDRSGSMGGWKMVAARRAVGRMIDSLVEVDRFAVLAFDTIIEGLPGSEQRLIAATDRHRWRALEWLGGVDARGGTEMGPALGTATQMLAPADAGREPIVVLVTDGQVAGEDAVLRTISQAASGRMPRIYTLGIDRAVNAGFLQRLADLGQGSCDLVESETQLDAAMDRIHRSIGTPVLHDLRFEPIGFDPAADSLTPSRIPDVFPDRPVTILGRCQGNPREIGARITGVDRAGNAWKLEVSGRPGPADTLKSLWGRAKVRDLEDRYASGADREPQRLITRIVEVSLEANVLSRFTAYVAVDSAEVVNPGGRRQQTVQPVETPAGWASRSRRAMSAFGGMLAASASPAKMRKLSKRSVGPASASEDSHLQTSTTRKRSAAPPPDSDSLLQELTDSLLQEFTDVDALESFVHEIPVLDQLVAAVRKALNKLKGRGWKSTRRKRLQHLCQSLQTLARHLVQEGHGSHAVFADLVSRATKMLEAHQAGDRKAIDVDRLSAFVSQVDKALHKMGKTPRDTHRSEGFWM